MPSLPPSRLLPRWLTCLVFCVSCRGNRFHAQWLASRLPWLTEFLSHTAIGVRQHAGKLVGVAAMGLPDTAAADKLLQDLLELLGNDSASKKPKYEEVDGSLGALG